MIIEVTPHPYKLPTFRAFMGLLPTMQRHMFVQVPFSLEALATFQTLEITNIFVYECMAFQCRDGIEAAK
jgi:hypothetical protein